MNLKSPIAAKVIYAAVTLSRTGKSFILAQTTKPRPTPSGGTGYTIKGTLLSGMTPKQLAEEAKRLGYKLASEPSEKSRFVIHGDCVKDWNGEILGKYSDGAALK